MPLFVVKMYYDAIDVVWPDIEEEIMNTVEESLSPPVEEVRPLGDYPGCCPNPLSPVRAFVLHNHLPCNQSTWSALYNPWWWFFSVIEAFPYFGVPEAWFLLKFFLIDRGDEYQLVEIILSIKKSQFVTGFISCVVGAIQLYYCVNSLDFCLNQGPGSTEGFYYECIIFIVLFALAWIAFFFVPSSVKKGSHKFHELSSVTHVEPEPSSEGSSGAASTNNANKKFNAAKSGPLKWFLYWDLVVFVLILGWLGLALGTRPYKPATRGGFQNNEWAFKLDVFWLRVIYGLLSFPFLLLLVPGFAEIFMHLRPTGYNRAGECVPLRNPDPPAIPRNKVAPAPAATPKQRLPSH